MNATSNLCLKNPKQLYIIAVYLHVMVIGGGGVGKSTQIMHYI